MTWRSIAVAVVVLGLFVAGALLTGQSLRHWQMVDSQMGPLLLIAALVMLVIAVLVARRVRTWKTRIKAFLAIGFLGTGGLTLILFGHLGACNALLDDSASSHHRVKVLEMSKMRRGRRLVEVESWRVPGEREWFYASADVVEASTELIVTTRSGALGFEWIDDVRAAR